MTNAVSLVAKDKYVAADVADLHFENELTHSASLVIHNLGGLTSCTCISSAHKGLLAALIAFKKAACKTAPADVALPVIPASLLESLGRAHSSHCGMKR